MYNSLNSSRAALSSSECADRAEQAERMARYTAASADQSSYLAEAQFWRSEAQRRKAAAPEERRSFAD